jgi:hypothetical protein
MLAAMTTAASSFNSDYYVATATVIPVLFLAIAVQGTLLQKMTKIIASLSGEPGERATTSMDQVGSFVAFAARMLLAILGLAVVFFGVGGEVMSILSLMWQRSVGADLTPGVAVIGLTGLAATAPTLAVIRNYLEVGGFLTQKHLGSDETADPDDADPAG